MWFTAIFEIEPNFETGEANIVWEWHIKDHLVQDRDHNILPHTVKFQIILN